MIKDVPDFRAVFIINDKGEKQNISSYTQGLAELSTAGN